MPHSKENAQVARIATHPHKVLRNGLSGSKGLPRENENSSPGEKKRRKNVLQ